MLPNYIEPTHMDYLDVNCGVVFQGQLQIWYVWLSISYKNYLYCGETLAKNPSDLKSI